MLLGGVGVFAGDELRNRLVIFFFDTDKFAFFVVIGVNAAVLDVVDPAVKLDFAGGKARGDLRMRAQMRHLEDDIFANYQVKLLVFRKVAAIFRHRERGCTRIAEPLFDMRQRVQSFRRERAFHGAALAVPANHNMGYVESANRKLNRGRHGARMVRVRRYNVAGVSANE